MKTHLWRKLLLESAVVVGSVYLAIVLEGASEARARHADSLHALTSLRAELALDRSDLAVILAAQRDRDVRHRRIQRWLGDIAAVPADSLTADFHALFSVNRTMFPRASSWTTMVASGQLSDLRDPVLVSRLANFYETLNTRLAYNGALYDEWVTDVARSAVPDAWDPVEGRLLARDADEVRRLRSRLIQLHNLAGGFIGLLEEWGVELDGVIHEVDGYIEREG